MFLMFFSYEATASLAKPTNRGIEDTQLARFSYGKLRSSYVNLYSFKDEMYSMSEFVKEPLDVSEELRMFKLIH